MRHHRVRPRQSRPIQVHPLVEELLDAWAWPLYRLDWPDRLSLLEQIDDKLQDELEAALAQRVSESFTARVIAALGEPPLTVRHQALAYLNSGEMRHRQAGRAWLLLRGEDDGTVAAQPGDRRSFPRHGVRLRARLDGDGGACLLDLSRGGARLAVEAPPPPGATVQVEIDMLGARPARVVTASAASVAGVAWV